MYFDAVVDQTNMPVFNGTPEEVKAYLEGNTEETNRNLHVFSGETLQWHTVRGYLGIA